MSIFDKIDWEALNSLERMSRCYLCREQVDTLTEIEVAEINALVREATRLMTPIADLFEQAAGKEVNNS